MVAMGSQRAQQQQQHDVDPTPQSSGTPGGSSKSAKDYRGVTPALRPGDHVLVRSGGKPAAGRVTHVDHDPIGTLVHVEMLDGSGERTVDASECQRTNAPKNDEQAVSGGGGGGLPGDEGADPQVEEENVDANAEAGEGGACEATEDVPKDGTKGDAGMFPELGPLEMFQEQDATGEDPSVDNGGGAPATEPAGDVGGAEVPMPDINPAAMIGETEQTIEDHVGVVQTELDGLNSHQVGIQQEINTAADSLNATTQARLNTTSSQFDTAISQSETTVAATYGEAEQAVGTATTAATGVATQASVVATVSVDTASMAQMLEVGIHMFGLQTDLEKKRDDWGSEFKKVITKYSGDLRLWVDKRVAEHTDNAAKEEQAAISAGESASPFNAMSVKLSKRVASKKAKKKVVAKYTSKMKALGELAAKKLEGLDEDRVVLQDRLLAPTINELVPMTQKHQEQVEAKRMHDRQEIEMLAKNYMDEAQQKNSTTVQALKKQKAMVEGSMATGKKQVGAQLDSVKQSLKKQTSGAADAVNDGHVQQSVQLGQTVAETEGVVDSTDFQNWSMEQQVALDAERDESLLLLKTGQQTSVAAVTEEAEQKKTEMTATADAQEKAVSAKGVETATELTEEGNTAATSAQDKATTSQTEMADESKQLADGAKIAGDAVVAGSDIYYQTVVTPKLQGYLDDAKKQILELETKLAVAITTRETEAAQAEGLDLDRRRGLANQGIDHTWGTDEAKLKKACTGLTRCTGPALQYTYRQNIGSPLLTDVYNDTSGDLYQSLKAWLKGDAISGAKYALKDEAGSWWSGPDMGQVEATMLALDDEQRAKLMADKEFPEIKASMTDQLQDRLVANKYDKDSWAALSDDKIKTKEELELAVDVIRLEEAFNDGIYFKTTDEAKAYALLGKRDKEGNEKLAQAYAKYTGQNLVTELDDEFDGLEEDRAMALLDGNKGAAKAAQLADSKGFFNDDEDAAIDALTFKDRNSGDWLAAVEAERQRQEMMGTFRDKYVPEYTAQGLRTTSNGEAATLGWLRDEYGDDHNPEERTDDVLADMLVYGEAAPEDMMAMASVEAGTKEQLLKKAVDQLNQIRDPELRAAKMRQMSEFFRKTYGIDDLESFLGIDPAHMEDPNHPDNANPEVSGGLAQELAVAWKQAGTDMDTVSGRYEVAQLRWRFDRGGDDDVVSTAVMDNVTLVLAGERMDAAMKKLTALYAEKSWQQDDRAVVNSLGKPDRNWDEFVKQAQIVHDQSTIYRANRDSLTGAVTDTLQFVGAVVLAAMTGGAGLPLTTAIIGNLIIAGTNMVIKKTMMGGAYGVEQARIDLGVALAEAATQTLSTGWGAKFKGVDAMLDAFGENKGLAMKTLLAAIKSVPGSTKTVLTNPATWEGKDLDEIIAATFANEALKAMASSLGEDVVKKGLEGKLTPQARQMWTQLGSDLAGAFGDPSWMSKPDSGLKLLAMLGKGQLTKAAVLKTLNTTVKGLNDKSNLTKADWAMIKAMNDEVREHVLTNLNGTHKDAMPADVLATMKTTTADSKGGVTGDTTTGATTQGTTGSDEPKPSAANKTDNGASTNECPYDLGNLHPYLDHSNVGAAIDNLFGRVPEAVLPELRKQGYAYESGTITRSSHDLIPLKIGDTGHIIFPTSTKYAPDDTGTNAPSKSGATASDGGATID